MPAMLLKYLKQQIRQFRLRRARILDAGSYRAEQIADWALWPAALTPASVVYSFGVGDNVAWDLEMIRRFGVTVHAFDPTPASIAWVKRQKLSRQFVFHDCGISNFDGTLDFYPPRRAGNTHYSQEQRAGGKMNAVRGRVNCLTTIMRRLGHRHIDVLKLDVEGSEFETIPDIIESGISVDQLLVEIHYHFRSRSFAAGLALINQLRDYGMQCIHISPRGFEFSFLRRGLAPATRPLIRAA
jgi:FkbM family methyltransferase